MGIYDEYEGVQLKVGDVGMCYYRIGDKVKLQDGVYVAPDGAVVIKNKKLFMTTKNVQDKWGGNIQVKNNNPIFDAAKKILIGQLQAENERLIQAIKDLSLDEYHKAMRDGCDANGAFDCLSEKIEKWREETLKN